MDLVLSPKKPPDQCISKILGIAEGLAYLHNHHTIHGDIKGTYILLNGDLRPVIYGLKSAKRDSEDTEEAKKGAGSYK